MGTNVDRPAATAVDTQPTAGLHTQEHWQYALSQSSTEPSAQELLAARIGHRGRPGISYCSIMFGHRMPRALGAGACSNSPWSDFLAAVPLVFLEAMAGRKEPVHDLLEGSLGVVRLPRWASGYRHLFPRFGFSGQSLSSDRPNRFGSEGRGVAKQRHTERAQQAILRMLSCFRSAAEQTEQDLGYSTVWSTGKLVLQVALAAIRTKQNQTTSAHQVWRLPPCPVSSCHCSMKPATAPDKVS